MNARVLVVGAGPVGLTMAAELARQGVPCRIIDRSPAPTQESRAIAIHARTLEVFAAMGIGDAFLTTGHRIHGVNIFAENQRILHLSFDELASPTPFAVDLPQSDTEQILTAHLKSLGVEIERGIELTGIEQGAAGMKAYASDSAIQAEYLVGCDGAGSTVRHLSGLQFDGESSSEHFLVADVPLRWDGADDEWHLWFHEDGLLTLFPLPGGLYRIVADMGQPVSSLDASHLKAVFEQRGPRHASLGDPRWLSSFQIAQRKVTEYQAGRIFLVGDAAHVQSPAASQGMNTGIQDAYNLAWKLAMVLRGNAPETLLASYTAEREPVARSVLTLTENMSAIAALRHPISQRIRNRLLPILAGFEVFENRLVSRLAELSINYRRSPIVGQNGRWYAAGSVPGDRAHDALLAGGKHLFEVLRGTRHVVLLFTADHPSEDDLRGFANIDRYMRDGYPTEMVTYLVTPQDLEWEGSKILDVDGNAHHAYAAGVPCVFLIRPDGYVGFRSLSADPLPLLEHLNRVYEPPMPDVK